ncbi:MAG TPA: ABC transporter permease [Bdellovibrionota bacterium]|nr:ABC transporter permease [Bdellovibrionota bacterium]
MIQATALGRLSRDHVALTCFAVILGYAVVALLAAGGLIAQSWDAEIARSYAPPSFESIRLIMGADLLGRSVFYKVVHGARIAMSVGLVSCLISIPVGVVLGALAGYFGGRLDSMIVWLYTVVSSVPNILLLMGIAFVLGRGLPAIYVALGATSWVGIARVIRGEVMRHKEREYVLAAKSIGAGNLGCLFRHILPNVFHFVIIQFSIQFVVAIRSEVVLSFLGLGVQGQPSWGIMIDDSKLELAQGVWWQLAGATAAMFFVILAFNILGDILRDVLDPRTR